MNRKLTIALAVALFAATGARAEITAEQAVTFLKSQGYSNIEIVTGVTQLKAEAVKDGRKVEAIYDLATGKILKTEWSAADGSSTDAVEIKTGGRDFLSASDLEDDDSADDHAGDDDHDGHDSMSDDDGPDHDSADDDSSDDDHGSDDDGGDDDSGDDD